MSGYEDTKKKIIDTIMGRPNGQEIQPNNHQDYALSLLDYIRRVELISSSTLVGMAQPDTVPVQPNDARVTYLSGVAQDRTTVYENFIDENGTPITIVTGEMEASFIILLWNKQFWSYEAIPTNIISSAEQANFYYSLQIRKTYSSISAMNADVNSPIGNDGRAIKTGEIVSVHNTTNSNEDGLYTWEIDPNDKDKHIWQLQTRLQVIDNRRFDGGQADSVYGGTFGLIDGGNSQG